MTRDNSVL